MYSELEKYDQRQVMHNLQKARDLMYNSLLTMRTQTYLVGTEIADLEAAIADLEAVEADIKAAYTP